MSGLEEAPFLQQFKGQNAVHEGDREKASSILKNLVYKPASELGRFKFIFSKKLREKHFTNIDKSKITINKENKVNLGQVSNDEVADHFRRMGYLKTIDLLWDKTESPKKRSTSKDLYAAEMLDVFEKDFNENKRVKKVIEDHEEEEMIAKARREIALQIQ